MSAKFLVPLLLRESEYLLNIIKASKVKVYVVYVFVDFFNLAV